MKLSLGRFELGTTLNRSIGCPRTVWSLRTSSLLCQRTTAHELSSQWKTFFELTFLTLSWWLEKRSWQISLPGCWTLKSLNVEKIIAVKDATLMHLRKKRPDKNEKFRLAGIRTLTSSSGGSRERVREIRPETYLRQKFLHRENRISLFNWLIFLIKHALHLATKLNSSDIKKCNCFWVPSYNPFASARKAVSPAPTATCVHWLRNTWSSPREVICRKSSTVSFFMETR